MLQKALKQGLYVYEMVHGTFQIMVKQYDKQSLLR